MEEKYERMEWNDVAEIKCAFLALRFLNLE
jgi:hypothetical protein